MKDPAVKLALVLCILASGVFVSMLLPHARPLAPLPQEPSVEDVILLRCQAEAARKKREQEDSEAARRSASAPLKPFDQVVPLPSLPADYPDDGRVIGVIRTDSPERTSEAIAGPRTHLVVDGDTLAALADRYLGSASRAQELFDANRDQIENPSLLRIGVELKIPAIRH